MEGSGEVRGENGFQNGNCWYTPRLFSDEWQIQDLRVTSLYEWQGKDLMGDYVLDTDFRFW